MRTFASFLSTFPTDGEPPGREPAVAVAAILDAAGHTHEGPEVTHGVAWMLSAEHGRGRVTCVVKLADTTAGRWLAELSVRKRGRALLSGRRDAESEEVLQDWQAALKEGLERDPRFSDVRWAPAGR